MLLKRAVDSSWTSDTPPSNLTRLQAVDAIRCRPREEHTDRPLVTILGERLEEHVDGSMPLPDRLDRVDPQRAVVDRTRKIMRPDVVAIGVRAVLLHPVLAAASEDEAAEPVADRALS